MTIPLRVKVVVALGNLGVVGLIGAIGVNLIFYYTDVAGIAPAAMSAAILLSRVWDIANDPMAGWLSDRTRNQWGGRRFYMLAGALPLGISSALIWWAPSGLSPMGIFVWILLAYVIFDTFLSLTWIPMNSLVSAQTADYGERARLAAWASAGALGGYLLGSAGFPAFAQWWGEPRGGFAAAGAGLGIVAAVCIFSAGLVLREPPHPPPAANHGWKTLFSALNNRPFRWVLAGASTARVGFTLMTAGLPFFVTHWLGKPRGVAQTMGFILLMVALFIPFWAWLARKWDKGRAYAVGLAVTGLAMASLYWVPAGGGAFIWIFYIVLAVGLAAHWVVPAALIPDAIDWDELRTGARREGIHFGLFGLMDKIARTMGLMVASWGLAAAGYQAAARTPESMAGFRLLFGPVTGFFLIAGAAFMVFYPITRAAHKILQEKITARTGGPQ